MSKIAFRIEAYFDSALSDYLLIRVPLMK